MATYAYKPGNGGISAAGVGDIARVSRVIDFAEVIAERAAVGQTALAAGDVLEVMTVDAGTIVSGVALEIVTAEGTNTTATVAVGDGTDADGFVTATATSTADVFGTAGAYTLGGKLYSEKDTLDLTVATAVPTNLVVRVSATFTRV